jgi:hypothetical protein
LLGFALLLNGCGGRAINKKVALDVIADSPAAVLARSDIDILSITQVGPREAIAETALHSAFRLERVGSDWVIREVRVGKGQWEKLDNILLALVRVKIDETRGMLERIGAAIESYSQKNGRLPVFKDYVELSNALYPLYLSPLIREDAWGQPLFAYSSGANAVRLVSAGPDGKPGTADDITFSRDFLP